jgi:hypothetical protein
MRPPNRWRADCVSEAPLTRGSFRLGALLCRQQAVFHPEKSWSYLGEAERWEHLAEAEISALFEECNTTKTEVPGLRPAA